MGKATKDADPDLDKIFGALSARPSSAAAKPTGHASQTTARPARPTKHGGTDRPRANGVAPPAQLGAPASLNAFQRRADAVLASTPAGAGAHAASSAKGAGKRKRATADAERSGTRERDSHDAMRAKPTRPSWQPIGAPDDEPADAEAALPVGKPRATPWAVELSDGVLAEAASGALLKLASAPPHALAHAHADGSGLGASSRLLLLAGALGADASGGAAARKRALDALLLSLGSVMSPLHAHALTDWRAGASAGMAVGGGGRTGAAAELDLVALELTAPAAAALLLAAVERLAGSRLAAAAGAPPARLAAARALLATRPGASLGEGCAQLVAQARAALASTAAAQLEPAVASTVWLAVGVSAGSAAEASALADAAAKTAATVGGGGAGVGAQLLKLCARHRQGKAAACAGVGTHAVACAPHPSPPAGSLSISYGGLARAKPLPLAPALALLELLDAHDWALTGNNRNPSGRKDGIQVDGSFSLGVGTARLPPAAAACPGGVLGGSAPFSTPCAFREGVGLSTGDAARKRHAALWSAALGLLRAIDPDYNSTSIVFNRNFRGSPHRDEKDAGPQVATALSAALRGGRGYVGGALRVYGPTGAVDVDTQNGWCRFDGRYRHEVLPFEPAAAARGASAGGGGGRAEAEAVAGRKREKGAQGVEGVRYSVIFYQLTPPYALDMSTVDL